MEFRQPQAIYLQIADHICENVLSERWREMSRIPSIREMAVNIEVNPNTVMRAYSYLQELGIIYNQRGIGYFVAKGARSKTLELMKKQFIRREVPMILHTMELLGMNCNDMKALQADSKTKRKAGK